MVDINNCQSSNDYNPLVAENQLAQVQAEIESAKSLLRDLNDRLAVYICILLQRQDRPIVTLHCLRILRRKWNRDAYLLMFFFCNSWVPGITVEPLHRVFRTPCNCDLPVSNLKWIFELHIYDIETYHFRRNVRVSLPSRPLLPVSSLIHSRKEQTGSIDDAVDYRWAF